MADKYYVGASAGTWNNTTTSWSLSDGGPAGSFVPVADDVVYVTKNIGANSFINVNQNIGLISKLVMGDSATPFARWYLSGTAIGTAGTSWEIGSGNIEINVPVSSGSTVEANIQLPMTGTGSITKTGPGNLYFDTTASRTYTGGLFVNEGYVGIGSSNVLGNSTSNTVTLADGTGLFSGSALGTTLTLANPITINGNVKLGGLTYASNNGPLSLTGLITIPGNTTRTITVDSYASAPDTAWGGTYINSVGNGIFSTSGFIKEGIGQLYLFSSQTLLEGPVTVNNGDVYIGWDNIGASTLTNTNTLPNISSLTVGEQGAVSMYLYSATPTNITVSNPVSVYGSWGLGLFTRTGSHHIDVTGAVSGTGKMGVYAFFLDLPSGAFTSKVRSSSTPSVLSLSTNGSSTNPRTAHWQYTGGTQTFDTSVLVDQGNNTITATYNIYIIENVGTGNYITTGGIDLASAGTGHPSRTLNIVATSGDFEFQGVVSNTDSGNAILSINKTGVNKLILSGDNTFEGTTTLTAGTLELGSLNALAFSTLVLVSGGGSLALSSGTSTVVLGNVTIPTGTSLSIPEGVEFRVGNKNVATTQTGTITGSGTLTKIGTNTLTLSNASNSFGYLTLAQGTISFGAASHLGGAVIGIGEYGSSYSGSLAFTYSGATSLTLSNNFVLYEGFTSSTTQNIVIDGSFTLNTNNVESYVTLTASGNITLNGPVVGANTKRLEFALSASKSVVLSANNDQLFSSIYVTSGFLNPTNDGAFGPSSVTSLISVSDGSYIHFNTNVSINQPSRSTYINGTGSGNGALYFNTSSCTYNTKIELESHSSITSVASSSVNLLSVDTSYYNATLTPATSSTIALSGALIGSGTFTKSGAGTVSLNAAGTFTGTTNVTTGTLSVSKSDATGGTGADIDISGGTIQTTVSTGTRLKTKDLTFSGGNLKIGA